MLCDLKGGKAGASSSLKNHGPQQAFKGGVKSGGVFLPWTNLNTFKFPHSVWYHFPELIKVGKFSFSSRKKSGLEQSPLEFQFIGSNDCKTWSSIQSYKTKFTKLDQVKTWTIPVKSRKTFRCYGIKVTKVTKGIYAAIKHFKMWRELRGIKINLSCSCIYLSKKVKPSFC